MYTTEINRLVAQRATAWEAAKAVLDVAEAEGRDLDAAEAETYDRTMADLDGLAQRQARLEAADKRTADMAATVAALPHGEAPTDARTDGDDPSADLRAWITGKAGRSFEARAGKPMGTDEFRTLSKLTPAAGANTVKISFYDRLIQHLIEVSAVLNAGPTVLNTSTGEPITIPKTTAHSSSAGIVAEGGVLPSNEPTFGQVTLDAFKYGFTLQVSHELANDTSVDLMGYLARQAGRALGNGFGAHLLTGTGTNQPNGLVTAATAGVTGATGQVGAPSADNLIDLYFSVIAPYRNSSSAAWLVKDTTLGAIRKLKDTTGQYLWVPSIQVGLPDTLLGKPIYTDPNVAGTALGSKSVLFGDISAYYVRLVESIRFERSDDYAFNTDLITYRALLRGDGELVDTSGAIKYFAGGAS